MFRGKGQVSHFSLTFRAPERETSTVFSLPTMSSLPPRHRLIESLAGGHAMPAEFKRVKEIFLESLDQADPDGRHRFLDTACGGDEELRRRVEELLRRHEQTGNFLEP